MDEALMKAAKPTGITEKTALVRMGLEALIYREGARRTRHRNKRPAE